MARTASHGGLRPTHDFRAMVGLPGHDAAPLDAGAYGPQFGLDRRGSSGYGIARLAMEANGLPRYGVAGSG